jgi:hypothetical protein
MSMNTPRGTLSQVLVPGKKVLNESSLTPIRLFDRICSSARLAGRHALVLAALSRFSHTGDPDGRHGSTPSPAFMNSEVTGTDRFNFDTISHSPRDVGRGNFAQCPEGGGEYRQSDNVTEIAI